MLTAHAWARWNERAYPMSYGELRAYLLTPERRCWIAMGVRCIRLPHDGVELRIKDGTIVTVVPLEERVKRRPTAWRGRDVKAELREMGR